MNLQELEAWETEIKITCLIDPVKFNENDVLTLVNSWDSQENDKPLFSIPIFKKVINWVICSDLVPINNAGQYEKYNYENSYSGIYKKFYREIQNFHIHNRTKHRAARYVEGLQSRYINYKKDLIVENESDKLNNWFNSRGETG